METYFDELCETLDCDEREFNMTLLERIRIMSLERDTPMSCIISGGDLTSVPTDFSSCKIIVLPMFGMNADAIGDVESGVYSEVKPRPDGVRMSCLMLADATVALNGEIPHWAEDDDEFHVLWLFDDEAHLTSHNMDDDLRDEMRLADAIAEDHDPLTPEEKQAWRNIAANADYVGVFDYIDFCAD